MNAVQRKQQRFGKNNFITERKMSNKTCFCCGETFPHEQQCPAETKNCHKCGKLGHCAPQCRTKNINTTNKTFYENKSKLGQKRY